MYSFPNLEAVQIVWNQLFGTSCSMSGSNCCSLTCIRVSQEAGKVAWYSYLFKNFLQFAVTHTVKGCSVVNEADVFLEFCCFFDDPVDVHNLISCSSSFSKYSLYTWKFLIHVLLKPRVKDFEHYLASMWNECNCVVISIFFGTAFLWDGNEKWPVQSCGHCWVFQIC